MTMPLLMSEEAWREYEDERTAYRYPNATAAEAAWQHAQGMRCSFDCAACDPYVPEEWEDAFEAPVAVRCGHCGGRHTVDRVRACARDALTVGVA